MKPTLVYRKETGSDITGLLKLIMNLCLNRYFPVVAVVIFWPAAVWPVMQWVGVR